MSPLKLNLCLHYYSSPEDDEWLTSGAPCVDDTYLDLERDGLIKRTGNPDGPHWTRTEKLDAFCWMLEQTPLPENPWCDPRTGQKVTRK